MFLRDMFFRLKEASGKVIREGFGTDCMGDAPCPFVADLNYSPHNKGTTGKLEAYTTSAAMGG